MEIFFNDKNKQKIDKKEHQQIEEEHKEVVKKEVDVKENEYENHNLQEGHEKEMNDKLNSGEDDRLARAYQRNIEYDMSTQKKQTLMKLEDKQEMEKMRRWKVKIYNIYITPIVEMLDPFLQFTIGGDFNVEVYKTKKGDTYKVPKGKRGYADKTEVVMNVHEAEKCAFDKVIDIEMRMTYSMINKQKMMLELWDYNSIWMNTIKSYKTLPLIDIVSGDCNVSLDMLHKTPGKKKPVPYAMVEFKCIFQEIWDFKLSFLNWKSTCITSPSQAKKNEMRQEELPSTQIQIELGQKDCIQRYTRATSKPADKTDVPIWSEFEGVIIFRGTNSELDNENVKISLYDTSNFFIKKLMASKIVPMKGIFEFQRLKTELTLIDPEYKDKYYVGVEGMANIDSKPRYSQTGENVVLLSKRKYLCIKVNRVENIRPAETRGIVDSFVQVEWCGSVQRTTTVKENNNPTFNEMLYFQVPLPEEYIIDPERHVQKINEEMISKNQITFNLMIEGDDNTYNNLGISLFHLSKIKEEYNQQQKQYFADDLKCDRKYVSRIYTGKCKLTSAFSLSNNTNVCFEAWFLTDFPAIVDFGEQKMKERTDKLPIELQPYYERGQDMFHEMYKRKIQDVFQKYANYPYRERMFLAIKPVDQYTSTHLLPYYLSLITMPEKLYSEDDMTKNPNFWDCNVNTLDEAAHYSRCFPFSLNSSKDASNIWSSPDFMLKIRKGDLQDHSILMACLMMGLKKTKTVKYFELANELIGLSKEKETTRGDSTTNGNINKETSMGNSTATPLGEARWAEKVVFPYENRVFVCLGKLKMTRQSHIWIMTIEDDYRTITFWEPKISKKYELQGRIDDPEKLKGFLNGKYPDYESVRRNKVIQKVEEESDEDDSLDFGKRNDLEEIRLRGLNEDSVLYYREQDDNYKDPQMNEKDNVAGDFGGAVTDDSLIKIKNVLPEQIDDNFTYKREDKKKTHDFLDEQKNIIDQQMQRENEVNFLPEDVFKDKSGKVIMDNRSLPYETIDIIFNRNNIYANLQYHDPALIKYNLFQKDRWLPYVNMNNEQIFKGKFEPFYSLSNFGACYSPGLVNKMKENLVKEMRVGITAARSEISQPTKFKKKHETINIVLQKYCDFMEERTLNRISEKQLKAKLTDWEDLIKSKIPKFFRMDARCVFFNFFEPERIRREINENLKDFLQSKIKNLMFATNVKVYAYMNQVVSVRIIIAKFYKIQLEDISDPSEVQEYKEDLKKDNNKLVEEESDSEEEEMLLKHEENSQVKIVEPEKSQINNEITTIQVDNVTPQQDKKEETEETDRKGKENVMIKI